MKSRISLSTALILAVRLGNQQKINIIPSAKGIRINKLSEDKAVSSVKPKQMNEEELCCQTNELLS